MAQVTLPEYRLAYRRVSGNLLVHLLEPGGPCDVEAVSFSDRGTISIRDNFGRDMLIFQPGTRATAGTYRLRAKQRISAATLNTATPLEWLTHPGAASSQDPAEIVQSWRGALTLRGGPDSNHLREPQLGALHAIASHWTASQQPATIVMPTGTGKTDTMIACLIYCLCQKMLVIVPSDALRWQIGKRLQSLGCLRRIGAVRFDLPLPRVGIMTCGPKSPDDAYALWREANAVVATAAVFTSCDPAVQTAIAEGATHVFIDEAHHIPAMTWSRMKERLSLRPLLQFTATPYRNDGRPVDGRMIYEYPLGRAQDAGYFESISLLEVEELDETRSDVAIATAAVAKLRADLAAGYDHLLLARVDNIPRADGVRTLYQEIAPDLQPVAVHSRMSHPDQDAALRKLAARQSRVLVCVDMFGEGFDLPNLKIAAMHDIHRSLPITLQFIGRFTRSAPGVGPATAVANIADPNVDGELESLYSRDPNWNQLLRRTSERRVARERNLHDFIQNFAGDLTKHLPLWNLRPAYSTMVYSITGNAWHPDRILEAMPRNVNVWHARNDRERVVVAVAACREEVKWGRYQNIHDHLWHLLVAHLESDCNLLYIYASDYDLFRVDEVARQLCGQATRLSGPKVFQVFTGVERPLVRNLGASKTGAICFTMYFGPEVSAGLSQVERSQSELNNLFGWGYQDGEKVSFGCSARKGKIWAATGGPIAEWRDWCHGVGSKLLAPAQDNLEVLRGFLRPEDRISRTTAVPLAVQWGEYLLTAQEDRVAVFVGGREFRLFEVTCEIGQHTATGPIRIAITTDGTRTEYDLSIGDFGGRHYQYRHVSGEPVTFRIGSAAPQPFEVLCERDPVVILYADGSFSYNSFFVQAPCTGVFPRDDVQVLDWTGTDIQVESQGKDRRPDSIQRRVIETVADDFELVFDDDASGEAADVIAIRGDGEDDLVLRFIHCKFASDAMPGARIDDLYELCGQAQKCVRWKHGGFRALASHMRRREARWIASGHSRFNKGTLADLHRLERRARHGKLMFEVVLVQPGVTKSRISESMLALLGATELYLKKTAAASMLVWAST